MKTCLLALSLMTQLFSFCQVEVQISGTVYDSNKSKSYSAFLKLIRKDSILEEVQVDKNGEFAFHSILNSLEGIVVYYKANNCVQYKDSIVVPPSSQKTQNIILDLTLLNRCSLDGNGIYYKNGELTFLQADILCFMQNGLLSPFLVEFTLWYNPAEGEKIQKKRANSFLKELESLGIDTKNMCVSPTIKPLTAQQLEENALTRIEGILLREVEKK